MIGKRTSIPAAGISHRPLDASYTISHIPMSTVSHDFYSYNLSSFGSTKRATSYVAGNMGSVSVVIHIFRAGDEIRSPPSPAFEFLVCRPDTSAKNKYLNTFSRTGVINKTIAMARTMGDSTKTPCWDRFLDSLFRVLDLHSIYGELCDRTY